jgi:hypothetical protein
MAKARIINVVFWLYIWLSGALMPDIPLSAMKLVSLNPHLFDDPPRFLGNGFIFIVLWALIDWPLRRASKARRQTANK